MTRTGLLRDQDDEPMNLSEPARHEPLIEAADEYRLPVGQTTVRLSPQTALLASLCLALTLVLLAAPPAQAQVDTDGSFGGLSADQRAYVRHHILRHLRDPMRVRLRDVYIVRDVFGWRGALAFCGEVAVHGTSGQQQGYEPFLIVPHGDDPSPIVRNPAAERPAMRAASRIEAAKACAEAARVQVGVAP